MIKVRQDLVDSDAFTKNNCIAYALSVSKDLFLDLLKQRFRFSKWSYVQYIRSCCHVVSSKNFKLQLKLFVNDHYVLIKVII